MIDDGIRSKEKLIAADPANLTERARLAQFYVERSEARERAGILTGALSDSQKALITFPIQASQDLGNASAKVRAQEVAAKACLGLGNIASASGSNPALPTAQRISALNAARSFYQKSLDVRRSISKPVTAASTSDDGADPNRLAKRIAECDRKLARLLPIPRPHGP